MGDRVVWRETVHDGRGRYEAATLTLRSDGLLALVVGEQHRVLDRADARSLFAALGDALQTPTSRLCESLIPAGAGLARSCRLPFGHDGEHAA